jgi:hypothetical protein
MRLGDGLSNVVDLSVVADPIFGNYTWQQELLHPTRAAYDGFGISVSISADANWALVGAPQTNYALGGSGDVQVFKRTFVQGQNVYRWDLDEALIHPEPATGDRFGWSCAISGDGNYALVGCTYDTAGGVIRAGSVQAYARDVSGWTHQQEIIHPTDPAQYESFGHSVSMSADGNYAIIGALYDNTYGTSAGTVHVWFRDGTSWTYQQRLIHPDPAQDDYFGYTVSISGDGKYAVAASTGDDTGADYAGTVQLYVRDGTSWTHQRELNHPNPGASDNFGIGLSMSGDGSYTFVGASGDDGYTGSAQVYFAPPTLVVSSGIRADGTVLSFTGQHICFPEGRMSQGLVVSANQNKYMSLNGPVTMGLGAIKSSESLPVVSLSNVVNDRSVFGVVDRFEGGGVERTQTIGIGRVSSAKEVGDNRVIVNSIGEGALWVANTNGNLVSGDYLTTSSLPGYAQKQDSDSLRNSTVAKITMDCDFSPEDLPVQIIKKKENGDNDLDPYGRFQWVDSEETQKAYKVRYLDVSGSQTDQSNAAHIAAYVGCTYHCG